MHAHVKYWEIIIEISATLDGIAALWRLRMTNADQFGLWQQSAATLDALLCMQIKNCLPFSNSNPQFKLTDIITSAIARNRMKYWEIIADKLHMPVGAWAGSQL
jgi:alpha-beta hydrolase superfamily lysophospholipase